MSRENEQKEKEKKKRIENQAITLKDIKKIF